MGRGKESTQGCSEAAWLRRDQAEWGRISEAKFLRVSFCTVALNFTFLFRNLEVRVIPTTGGYSVYPVRWNM